VLGANITFSGIVLYNGRKAKDEKYSVDWNFGDFYDVSFWVFPAVPRNFRF
jgi:hypothetical protein